MQTMPTLEFSGRWIKSLSATMLCQAVTSLTPRLGTDVPTLCTLVARLGLGVASRLAIVSKADWLTSG